MKMSDLKAREPFFQEWYIESTIRLEEGESVFKIYRDQNGQREYSAMKVIGIPRDEEANYNMELEKQDDDTNDYYHELVTDIYREICLLEKIPDRQHIVSYQDHMIFQRTSSVGYEIVLRTELLEEYQESINASFMTYQDVILLGKNICEALDLCERYHIIHGNIRPECIYLSEHGQYKLGDFGFSHYAGQIGAKNFLQSPNGFTAPEIISDTVFDSRADIYSLGMMLYSCLNNNQLPEDIYQLTPPAGATEELGQVIMKACNVKPEARYQSAEEFKDALISIGIFLGESVVEPIDLIAMEEPELYVAATSEDDIEMNQAKKQLLDEVNQTLSEQIQSFDKPKEKKPLRQDIPIKRTKYMGPWILIIWVSILTIAVLVLLLKSNLGLEKENESATGEELAVTSEVKPTQVVGTDDPTSLIIQNGEQIQALDETNAINQATIIDLSENAITDLSSLSEASKVEVLKLNHNEIEDIVPLQHLDTLKELDLANNHINSVVELRELHNLQVLCLSNNSLTQVLGLEQLTNLTMLYLDGNEIENVSKLSALTNLIFLDLSYTKVSERAIQDLQKALPDCIINY